MSERKVLNKYYPPDFDPAKIPRLKLPKNRQYVVRLMAPCNMRCTTCGEYIYKGRKFNARKETVQNEEYLGIKVFRFYIKCTRCMAEITFKTDPKNADYQVEHGATRNFQAFKLAAEQAERERMQTAEEEANNPMKLLENRTKASKSEMEIMDGIGELKDLNQRQANVDFDKLLKMNCELAERGRKQQEDEDEAEVKLVFGKRDKNGGLTVKRLRDDSSSDEEEKRRGKKMVDVLEKKSVGIVFAGVKKTSLKSKISSFVRLKPSEVGGSKNKAATSNALSLLSNYFDSDSDAVED